MANEERPNPRRKLFENLPYGGWFDDRENPVQPAMDLGIKADAKKIAFEIPQEWNALIMNICKKCKCEPEFVYRKAFQAFFGLNPVIWDDDGYLREWREVLELDGEHALRDEIQEADDALLIKIIRERTRQLKKRR